MIVKLIGAVIFVIGGFLLGKSIEKKYVDKIELWNEINVFLTACQSKIQHDGATIEDICAWQRQQSGKFSHMIADAVQYNSTEEETKLLHDFSTEVGSVDSQTQTTVFSKYKNEAQKTVSEAKNKYKKNGKTIYRLIPILFIGIVVLLW